jgi:hypothetical protein
MLVTESIPEAVTNGGPLERVHHPEIVPLEVGDLWVDEVVFREQMLRVGFVPALRQAIILLSAGRGATRSNGPLPPIVAGFEAVYLTGGRANDRTIHEGLAGLDCEFISGTDGAFAGLSGGFELLRARGRSGWVLDLGQSQLKLASSTHAWTWPRDSARMPDSSHTSLSTLPTHRRRLKEFIALKLQFAIAESREAPQTLVAALPSRLADDGTPLYGTYAGLRGNRRLVPDALELAGLQNVPVFVLNDAELAAHSARLDPRLAGYQKILVLTLGFGIGAALIQRAS